MYILIVPYFHFYPMNNVWQWHPAELGHSTPFSHSLPLYLPCGTVLLYPAGMPCCSRRTFCLQVCREFQRGACKRPEPECRFAHPPDHVVTTDEGTVTVCMDAIKSRCSRDPCRYFHPPPHLQAQLRANQGRAAQHGLVGSLTLTPSCLSLAHAHTPFLYQYYEIYDIVH